MSKLAIVNQSQTTEFQTIVGQHFLEAAIAIMAESPETANHAERIVLAKSILAGGLNTAWAARIIATNATVAGYLATGTNAWAGQDSDLAFVVASVWDAMAGVST